MSSIATDKYYVDYNTETCKQDCLVKDSVPGTKNCGGLAPSHKTLFSDATTCCEKTLFWKDENDCVAKSTDTESTAVGSGKWYVDWIAFKCVKDCDDSADSQCGK